jgi:hypothetical protein
MTSDDTTSEFSHDVHTKVRGKAAVDLWRRILGQPDPTEEGLKDLGRRLAVLEEGMAQLLDRSEADPAYRSMQNLDRRIDGLEKGVARVLQLLEEDVDGTSEPPPTNAHRDSSDVAGGSGADRSDASRPKSAEIAGGPQTVKADSETGKSRTVHAAIGATLVACTFAAAYFWLS